MDIIITSLVSEVESGMLWMNNWLIWQSLLRPILTLLG